MDYIVSNSDTNVSPKILQEFIRKQLLFEDAADSNLAVTKIFPTFQGEMPYAGTPCVFVRLAGCNRGAKLSCAWCDTEFALNNSTLYGPTNLWLDLLEKFKEIWPANESHSPLVVFTGGEPTMQFSALQKFFNLVADRCGDDGYLFPFFQFESNGDHLNLLTDSVFADERLMSTWSEHFTVVISPKAHPETGFSAKVHRNLLALQKLKFLPKIFIRCVVSNDPSDQYYQLPEWLFEWAEVTNTEVFLSPITVYNEMVNHEDVINIWFSEKIDRDLTLANYRHALNLALQYQFRLSCQTHLLFAIE